MKKIIVDMDTKETVHISQIINTSDPIFAKRNGKLAGMVMQDTNEKWILRINRGTGSNGYYDDLQTLLIISLQFGYEFFT